ncbi:MAG: hypothetical protein L3J31_00120 [Bacteroidales bacterium]|nr:hypothetical protein [Bacteroidales bacterium]
MAKIKQVSKYTAFVGEDGRPINEFKSLQQEFDEQQNLLKEIEYASNGKTESASAYKYNDQNKMISEIHYFEEGEVGEAIHYHLDEEGKPVEIETTYGDSGKSIKKIKRSERFISVKIIDEEGDNEGEETIKFDNKQRPIEETHFDEEGHVSQRSVYEYDESDLVLSRIDYGENNELLTKTTFAYNEGGKLIQSVQRSGSGNLINSVLYEYDENGNRILLQNSHHQQRTTYDKQNRIISEETINRSNNLVEGFTEYKYSDHGLVVEERTFEMGNSAPSDPLVFGGAKANFLLTRYEYEFY